MPQLKTRLMSEEQVVHLPEPSLRSRRFCRLCRNQRMRVDLFDWKVAEYNPYTLGEAPEQQRNSGRCLLAVRTFEIAVLDDRNRRAARAADVVIVSHRI